MIKLCKKQGFPITPEIENELESQNINVFQTDISWKTFIPPLPQVNFQRVFSFWSYLLKNAQNYHKSDRLKNVKMR